MFFGKPDQFLDQNNVTSLRSNLSVVAPEHLVDFAGDDSEVGFGEAVFEGREGQVEAALVVAEMPRPHVIAGYIIEFDLIQFLDAIIQDEGILGGDGQVTKTKAEIQAEGATIRQEAGSASPVPEGAIFPDAASPIERAEAFVWFDFFLDVTIAQRAAGGQTVDLAVVVEALFSNRDDDGH